MSLVGYCDKLSVEPSDTIAFMVSSVLGRFDASLVRLIHGDTNPAGPGFKALPVESAVAGEHPGKRQELRPGSYVRIPAAAPLDVAGSFTIHAWIRPTMPDKEMQTLLSRAGMLALRLEHGRLSLALGSDAASRIRLEQPVALHAWYSAIAVYDAAIGQAHLSLRPLAPTAGELGAEARRAVDARELHGTGDLLIAAELVGGNGHPSVGNFYNGKIDAPRLFDRALGADEIAALRTGADVADGLVGAWDFSRDIASGVVSDASSSGLDGRAVNKPTRGVTGWNWDGSETAWPHAPRQYGAIHFHDDDLGDAGWEPSLRWAVPTDTPSGIYALHLRAGDDEDYIPFVVRPKRGRPRARIALLLPTFSYLAYANEHAMERSLTEGAGEAFLEAMGVSPSTMRDYPSTPQERYIVENRLNSLYDLHTDGSGVCYSSRLRPLVNMRPSSELAVLRNGEGSPHQLNADLHLVDWLHASGYDVDVVTDEDLHLEGAELIEPYSVVLTGSHHEYWTIQMIRATQRYLCGGGRLMYLAGNGMYWVTQHDPEHGNGIEIRRRGPSSRAWEPEPGEAHLSATGELGGLWRYRGIAPQSWLGVGFTAQGFGEGRPYERQPVSFEERNAWIFEGVDDDELIGDFPSLVNGYGAAGFEIDRVDHALGTPHRTQVLATATGFTDSYQHAVEEVFMSDSSQGGTRCPQVRADMVLLEYPNGGAVFSPGSIAWSACLSYNGYDNNVARVTRNVLDRFASPGR